MPHVEWPENESSCPGATKAQINAAWRARRRFGGRPYGELPREALIWRAVDGHLDTMDSFTDSHLLNVQRYLTGRANIEFRREDMSDEKFARIFDLFEEEIRRRGLEVHKEANEGAREREFLRQQYELSRLGDPTLEQLLDGPLPVDDYMRLVEQRYKETA